MSKIELIMPKMGESVAEATIIKWVKNIGDSILENLRTRKLISRFEGDFYINNTGSPIFP